MASDPRSMWVGDPAAPFDLLLTCRCPSSWSAQAQELPPSLASFNKGMASLKTHANVTLHHQKWQFYQISETRCISKSHVLQEGSSAGGNVLLWYITRYIAGVGLLMLMSIIRNAQVTLWLVFWAIRFDAAKILHPAMSIQVMLSAHHLCIFVSNLHRQLNEARSKPIKVDIMILSEGLINLAVRVAVMLGIIFEASHVSLGIN